MLDFEEQFYNEKIKVIVGVDEAGRGPLCGPVVAAACILPRTYINEKINDSKKLSENENNTGITIKIREPKTAGSIKIKAVSLSFLFTFD